MSFTFNYKEFFDYYTNPVNYFVDDDPRPDIYYFPKTDKSRPLVQSTLSEKYIMVGDIKIYVNLLGVDNDQLMFSIPKEINGFLCDIHYHIGIKGKAALQKLKLRRATKKKQQIQNKQKKKQKNKNKSKRLQHPYKSEYQLMLEDDMSNIMAQYKNPSVITDDLIFFHKTEQYFEILEDYTDKETGITKPIWFGKKKHRVCSFGNNSTMNIDHIDEILCLNDMSTMMGDVFNDIDFDMAEDIIRRPFTTSLKEQLKVVSLPVSPLEKEHDNDPSIHSVISKGGIRHTKKRKYNKKKNSSRKRKV